MLDKKKTSKNGKVNINLLILKLLNHYKIIWFLWKFSKKYLVYSQKDGSNWWHPFWFLFLTIPLYYMIGNFFKKLLEKEE